ncbi:hypothetical protein EJ04DRAFT_512722 [Polyplosphaeria fusca]|uniref:Uncharacterized protein n=1 Tax=Polyplosphaeria fusca TaxID=682080 RepID=A0A9P4UZC3_9PLEO|nr:hypothetical protein EJ04DRAFT_512722 [Polyplosphaeria fusca]
MYTHRFGLDLRWIWGLSNISLSISHTLVVLMDSFFFGGWPHAFSHSNRLLSEDAMLVP